MADLGKTYLFRMTHIDNIPHVIAHGITHALSTNAHPAFTPIGDSSLISTRSNFVLDNGRRLGDYIPFYFGYRTPMLFVIQKGYNTVLRTAAEDIVYCVCSVQSILDNGLTFVFTDGHAVNRFSNQYSEADVDRIDELLDWPAIGAKFWNSDTDLDLKRRKEAEFLVEADVPFGGILGFVVFNEAAKNKLVVWGISETQVAVRAEFYF